MSRFNKILKSIENASKPVAVEPGDHARFQEGEPRNVVADFANPYLDKVGLEIPKISVADRKEFMNDVINPEQLVLNMGIGGITRRGLSKVLTPEMKEVAPQEFFKNISDFRSLNDMNKANIHPYTADEYTKMKTFLSKDGQSGFALKPDGELVSVHSAAKGRGEELVDNAVRMGAKKLDAYDIGGKLPNLYGKYGFRENGRHAFNPEYADPANEVLKAHKPDFVEMAVPKSVASPVPVETVSAAGNNLKKLNLLIKQQVLQMILKKWF
jgi:hypothetical protein